MVALSVTVHKALILLVFLNHPYQSLAFMGFVGVFYVQMGTIWVHNLTLKHKNVSEDITSSLYPTSQKNFLCYFPYAYYTGLKIVMMYIGMQANVIK